MKKSLFLAAFILLIGGFLASSVRADDDLVKFKGGIGVIPVSNVVVNPDGTITVNRNIVRGVNPAGQIWVIRKLNAKVETNGDIKVEGKGLVLGGGNNIGRATGQSVFATLLCGNDEHESGAVPLEANGDFEIDDVLTPIPPSDCDSPVLLIRNASGRAWFAAGIPKLD